MTFHRPLLLLGAAGALLAALSLLGCSKDNTPTSPIGGGGGGGGLELNSGTIAPGGVYAHVFATAGAYPYHCTLHATMTGDSVYVSPGAGDSAFVQIVSMEAPGYSPRIVSVKPGGRVRWLNVDTFNHTVTSGH